MESGGVLVSRAVTSQVPSALRGLTSVFGMGTGGTLLPSSPEFLRACFPCFALLDLASLDLALLLCFARFFVARSALLAFASLALSLLALASQFALLASASLASLLAFASLLRAFKTAQWKVDLEYLIFALASLFACLALHAFARFASARSLLTYALTVFRLSCLEPSYRPISIGKLHHCWPYTADLSPLRLRWVSHIAAWNLLLEVGFTLRCLQRLSAPHFASQLCRWHDNCCTRDASTPVLSY